MAYKRDVVAQTSSDDLKLVAEAAEKGATIKNFNSKDLKKINRVVKLIRTIKGAQ